MKTKTFNIGGIKMRVNKDGLFSGFVLKRDLTFRECKYVLEKFMHIEVERRGEFLSQTAYRDRVNEYVAIVNGWLKGEVDDFKIDELGYYAVNNFTIMCVIPILNYLKKKGIVQ